MMTNAEYARRVAHVLKIVALESADLAAGMWNPHFCSADATTATGFMQELQDAVDDMKRQTLREHIISTTESEYLKKKWKSV